MLHLLPSLGQLSLNICDLNEQFTISLPQVCVVHSDLLELVIPTHLLHALQVLLEHPVLLRHRIHRFQLQFHHLIVGVDLVVLLLGQLLSELVVFGLQVLAPLL